MYNCMQVLLHAVVSIDILLFYQQIGHAGMIKVGQKFYLIIIAQGSRFLFVKLAVWYKLLRIEQCQIRIF